MLADYSTEQLEQMAEVKRRQEADSITQSINNMMNNGAMQQVPQEQVQQPVVQQPQQPTDKQAVIADILGKIASGYKENRDTGLLDKINQAQQMKQTQQQAQINGEVLPEQPEQPEKTGWNRFGQTLGTAARVASNPLVQGIAAGVINGRVTGDWGKGLEYGIQYAQNKAKSDAYEKMMGRTPSILGSYGADDYKAQADVNYKNNRIEIEKQKAEDYSRNIDSQIEQRAEKLKIDKAKLDEQIRYHNITAKQVAQRLNISQQKANAYIKHVQWQEKHGGKTAKQNADIANQKYQNAMKYINTLPKEDRAAAYEKAYQDYQDSIAFNEDDDIWDEED